jgi:hypothetical protein
MTLEVDKYQCLPQEQQQSYRYGRRVKGIASGVEKPGGGEPISITKRHENPPTEPAIHMHKSPPSTL